MSPHPATHRNGVCTGSLWKSHSRKKKNAPSAVSTVGGAPKRQMVTPGSEDFHLGGILAEANERQRMHEFCVLVGNTLWSYSDVWAYAKGDSPTVSNYRSNEMSNSNVIFTQCVCLSK